MEIKVKIKDEVSIEQLENNYDKIIDRIWDICNHNDYNIKVITDPNDRFNEDDSKEPLHVIKPHFGNISKNGRKNIGKRFQYCMNRGTLRTMNILFLVLRKLGVIEERVRFTISNKEKEINRLRRVYKIMRAKTEEARLEYKKEKGNFYK